MLFFSGWALSSLIIPPFADKYGRKKIYVGLLFFNILSLIGPIFLPKSNYDYVVLYVFVFINGVLCGGRFPIGYTYMIEMLPT